MYDILENQIDYSQNSHTAAIFAYLAEKPCLLTNNEIYRNPGCEYSFIICYRQHAINTNYTHQKAFVHKWHAVAIDMVYVTMQVICGTASRAKLVLAQGINALLGNTGTKDQSSLTLDNMTGFLSGHVKKNTATETLIRRPTRNQ